MIIMLIILKSQKCSFLRSNHNYLLIIFWLSENVYFVIMDLESLYNNYMFVIVNNKLKFLLTFMNTTLTVIQK